jgi:prepilin-type N-terminal cleavage/methylation domain-containing protein
MSFARLQTRTRHSSAFTLVELMIVIAIVGILASLVTVGVMKAFERSKLVSARIEISQLEAAVAAAKLDLGNVDELPSRIILYSKPIDMMSDNSQLGVNSRNFLTKAFGKTWFPIPNPVGSNNYSTNASMFWMGQNATYPVTLQGMDALVYFLGGLKQNGSFQGFSASKSTPWDLTSSKRKGPYYSFENSRLTNLNSDVIPSSYLNAWGGAYTYFSKSDYVYFTGLSPANTLVYPYRSVANLAANSFYNPKTFQIISSGPDQTFGKIDPSSTNPIYAPPYSSDLSIYDDLSNFSSTQLGKKDE